MSVPIPILQYNLSDASVKGLLPSGYTPLAYIESSGTLYINTGIAFNGTSSTYLINCRVGASTRAGHAHSFFGTASYLTGFMGIYHYTNNNYYSEYIANANKGTQGLVIAAGNIFDYYLKMNMSARTYASKLAYASEVTGSFNAMSDTSTPLRIFKSDDYSGGYWKCYYFSITKDNVLQVDLRPARRDSDGVIGMYDLVSRTFKTNSGSGVFIAGPELAVGKGGSKSLPEEYLLVEYLESIGGQHIDTGVKFTNGGSISAKILFTGNYTGTDFGIGNWTSGNRYSIRTRDANGGIYLLYAGGDPVSIGTGFNILYDVYLGPSMCKINGTNYNHSLTASDNGTNIFLFAAGGPTKYYSKAKIYNVKIMSDSSTTVRNFIPCYRKSDMKPGMYDTVNGVFYTNSGSGEFILGPSITNCYTYEPNASGKAALNPYDTTIYTESDGSRWMRIFHHNNPANSKFASSANLSNLVYESADKWSCINLINKDLGNWELMLKLKDTSSSSEVKYRWIQYYNPFTANWSLVLPGNVLNVSGYSGTQGGMWAMNSSDTYFVIANTSSSNWFGAIGGKSVYNGGIPGYPNTTCKTGYMDLYVRIDNNTSFNPDGLYTNVSSVYDSSKGWVAGFNGNTPKSHVIIPSLTLDLRNITIAGWINFTSTGGYARLCDFLSAINGSTSGNGDGFLIARYSSTSTFAFHTYSSGTDVNIVSVGSITNGTWAHVALVISGGTTLNAYVNGVKVGTKSRSNSMSSSANLIYNWLGHSNWTVDPYLDGQITNFLIFNVALTAAQVKELYGG